MPLSLSPHLPFINISYCFSLQNTFWNQSFLAVSTLVQSPWLTWSSPNCLPTPTLAPAVILLTAAGMIFLILQQPSTAHRIKPKPLPRALQDPTCLSARLPLPPHLPFSLSCSPGSNYKSSFQTPNMPSLLCLRDFALAVSNDWVALLPP